MRFIRYFLLIVLVGCESKINLSPERLELAFVNDSSQFADGCELFIELDKGSSSVIPVHYKPSSATLILAQKALRDTTNSQSNAYKVPVTIRFQETGNQTVIHCGWSNSTVPEITVLEVDKR